MSDKSRIITDGPFKGKKIELAPTAQIGKFSGISYEFIKNIFGFEPDEYLITDESRLRDFTELEELRVSDIQQRIQEVYGVDVSDIKSGNLLHIFKRIYDKSRTALS